MKKLKTRAEIDLAALKNNYKIINEYIKSYSPECEMICVVKADAYGHGAKLCIPALCSSGAGHFAVSCIDEAQSVCEILKESSYSASVFILGPTDPEYIEELAELNIIQTVSSHEYALSLQKAAEACKVKINVAVKLDTGMNRIGYPVSDPTDTLDALLALCDMPNLNIVSLFTHFACADEPNDSMTREQYARFTAVASKFKDKHPEVKLQCCNSAAAVRYPDMHLDLVRIGLILYGLAPSEAVMLEGIKPVMSLYSTVTHIHKLLPDQSVSYGATFKADREMTVATVGIGYGDGFIRACAENGYLIINGKKAKIIGRICMDQCMVDVSDIEVSIGDEAVVFDTDGKNIEELAKAAKTINYELICLLSPRVKRIAK